MTQGESFRGPPEPASAAAAPPPSGAGAPLPPRSRFLPLAVGAGVFLLAALGVGLCLLAPWRWGAAPPAVPPHPSPPDPRLSYEGRFQNIRPDVEYVGDSRCAECHLNISQTFRKHPMGRSIVPIRQAAATQVYDAAHHNPFDAFGLSFRAERRGEGMVHREARLDVAGKPAAELEFPVDYAIGSGVLGHSYLSFRDGFLFQTPISWFTQKQIWDLSPGFSPAHLAGRPVSPECIFCHANRAHPREGTVNSYHEPLFEGDSIGCERCHGPGGQHVQHPGHRDPVDKADHTIVNPHWLAPDLRESVCNQCHLEGVERVLRRGRDLYDFRPGMPLGSFWSVFVDARGSEMERKKAVNHVEQMDESRCYLRSSGANKLGCVSCHDPHVFVGPEERTVYYRGRCQKCHDAHGCSLPEPRRREKSPDDSCIQCHMPHYAGIDIAHSASTDHRILRQPEKEEGQPNASPPRAGQSYPVKLFHHAEFDPADKEAARDRGIALFLMAAEGKARPREIGEEAVALLEDAVRNDPDDLFAWETKGSILRKLDRPTEALDALEICLAKGPERERALTEAAYVCATLQRTDAAIGYWRRAIAVNPRAASYRANLVQLLFGREAWDEMRPHCREWVRLEPSSLEAHKVWMVSLLKEGDKDAARAELATLAAMQPARAGEFRHLFEKYEH